MMSALRNLGLIRTPKSVYFTSQASRASSATPLLTKKDCKLFVSGPIRNNIVACQACLHTTATQNFPGQDWRKKRGLAANPNLYGPLSDGPDYSFLDGRQTPVGSGKIRRVLEQREIAAKIMTLSSEVDFAVKHHAETKKTARETKAKIIANKLKSKGNLPPESRS